MAASLPFVNMLEDVIENDLPVQVCSWDITKAFDSLSNNVTRLAWTRIGFPESWVNWLVATIWTYGGSNPARDKDV